MKSPILLWSLMFPGAVALAQPAAEVSPGPEGAEAATAAGADAGAQAPATAADPAAGAGVDVPAVATPAPAPARVPAEMGTLVVLAKAPGLEVRIGGNAIGVTPLPGPWTISAGRHEVEVGPREAPVHRASLQVGSGQRVEIAVKAPLAPPPVVVEERAPTGPEVVHVGPGFSLARAGYITAGAGLLAIGAGVYFGLQAQSDEDSLKSLDRSVPRASRAAADKVGDRAESNAFWANVSYGVGGVATLAGVGMFLLASDGPLGGSVAVVPSPSGVAVGGVF